MPEKNIEYDIKKYADCYKLISILSLLSIKQNDFNSIEKQYKLLKRIWNELLDLVKNNYAENVYQLVKILDTDNLPNSLIFLKTIDIYNKILALKYIDVSADFPIKKIKLCKMSIDFNYKDELAYLKMAKYLLDDKKYAEVIELCDYIQTFSNTAPVWEILGDTYAELENYGKSIESYKKYIEINDGDEEVVKKLNTTYTKALT